VNFCSRDFLFNKEFDDSTLAKRHIVVGHFVRSDNGHVMQAIDVTRHSRIIQQLVPSTTVLSFVCCCQFACKKLLLMNFGTTLVVLAIFSAEVHTYQKMKTVSNNTVVYSYQTTWSSSGRAKYELPRACLSSHLCGMRSYGKNVVCLRTKLNKIHRLKNEQVQV